MRASTRRWPGCAVAALSVAIAPGCSDRKVETGRQIAEEPAAPADAAPAADAYLVEEFVSAETVEAARALDGLIDVRVYFADEGPISRSVRAYFRTLGQRSGNLQLRDVSPDEDPRAPRAVAGPEGRMVAIEYGGRRRAIGLSIRDGQVLLPDLDTVVREVLSRLAPQRSSGVVYRTTEHGELQAEGGASETEIWAGMQKLLREQGYALKDLARRELRAGVPGDADAVVVLGPTQKLDARECAALEAYLSGGGALLVALDPAGKEALGSLAGHLGIRYEAALLHDDEHTVRARGGATHPTTREFAEHPAVASAAKGSVWIPLLRSGALWDAARGARTMQGERTRIVQSASSAFLDRNGNGVFDKGVEKRGAYTVAVALDARARGTGGRAVVFADAQLFSGPVLSRFRGAELVGGDVLRWLLKRQTPRQ